jgi:hypothetical protein
MDPMAGSIKGDVKKKHFTLQQGGFFFGIQPLLGAPILLRGLPCHQHSRDLRAFVPVFVCVADKQLGGIVANHGSI